MMLRELLSVRPPETEVRAASRRARIEALARFDGEQRSRTQWLLPLAAALTAAVALLLFVQTPAATNVPAGKQPLRMNLTLTDGTRVVWTFDDTLGL